MHTRVSTVRVAGAVLLLCILSGCGAIADAGQRTQRRLVEHFDAHARARSPVADQVPAHVREHRARGGREATPAPARIEIPAIGVSSALDRLDLGADGAIETPPRWETAGWYRGGVKPGQRGPAVILGHVDSTTGPAVFYRLDELEKGDRIRVERADGSTARFVVRRTKRYPKARFPTGEVYLPTSHAALRLVTCTGEFDRDAGSYRDNLVVFADLVE